MHEIKGEILRIFDNAQENVLKIKQLNQVFEKITS